MYNTMLSKYLLVVTVRFPKYVLQTICSIDYFMNDKITQFSHDKVFFITF